MEGFRAYQGRSRCFGLALWDLPCPPSFSFLSYTVSGLSSLFKAKHYGIHSHSYSCWHDRCAVGQGNQSWGWIFKRRREQEQSSSGQLNTVMECGAIHAILSLDFTKCKKLEDLHMNSSFCICSKVMIISFGFITCTLDRHWKQVVRH